MHKLIALLVIAGLAGCTTVGTPFTPAPVAPEGKALVYFMRSSVGIGNFWPTVFSVNDTAVVSLYDKGYSWIHLDAGLYKISGGTHLNNDYLKFILPVRAGSEIYVEYDQTPTGYNTYRNQIRAVPPNEAKAMIAKYNYLAADLVAIPKQLPGLKPRPRLSETDELEHVKKIAAKNNCANVGEPKKTARPDSKNRLYEVACENGVLNFECGVIKEGLVDESCWRL